ncbi:SH3 domain-containing protein [Candidatus Sumerlaeota bacterium]|nr:SH3 domain-containing protein [Candidatus Sumerlaeota bacterium]
MKKLTSFLIALGLFGCSSGSTGAQQPAGRRVDPPVSQPATGAWAQTPKPTVAPPTSTVTAPANQGIARITPRPTVAASAAATGATMYVSAANTVVRQSTSLSSPTVEKLQPGAAVTVAEKGAVQYKVRTASGATGYVSKLNLKDTPPATQGGRSPIVIASTGPSDRDNINIQRGLSATTEQAAKQGNLPEEAIADAKSMEECASKISNADLDAFLVEGKVYAP